MKHSERSAPLLHPSTPPVYSALDPRASEQGYVRFSSNKEAKECLEVGWRTCLGSQSSN